MRFFVPEWDDAVDAHYDFVNDALSTLEKSERERHFIWDVFDRESLPIDGVLISREQVEGSASKAERLTEHGVYDAPQLSIPEWLPTISDCGAWGYKQLPFPPYSNEGMLEFYETLDVDVGVTIDHLVLGSGKAQGRLYLDDRAFHDGFSEVDLPPRLTEQVDVMVDEWPEQWPAFVASKEPSITEGDDVSSFQPADFEGPVDEILDRLDEDPRAVYRRDDALERYELTLDNARDMRRMYDEGDWSFRLMAAFQGWDPESYGEAVSDILEMGYDYVGIGGVAGSPGDVVEDIVGEVGQRIQEYERSHGTRIDAHVFGFAKVDSFETVGRSGMTSFDSASMLRAAWTGGKNYHLGADERYDAIRVRYPQPGDPLDQSIEKALMAQEVLAALRAYDRERSVPAAIGEWHDAARVALEALPDFLLEHRHDDGFDRRRLRDVRAAFRSEYPHAERLFSSFGKGFRRELVRLLREDAPDSFVPFSEYEDLIDTARQCFDQFPQWLDTLSDLDPGDEPFNQAFHVLQGYASSSLIDDEDLLRGYRETLTARPWERCDCPLCNEHGIEIAIFRGNNRNRRRGFHNTRRFYDQFERTLPKLFVAAPATTNFFKCERVETFLRSEYPSLWQEVHDLPVVEIGVCDANGMHEWWEDGPRSLSLEPGGIEAVLRDTARRYDTVYVYDPDHDFDFHDTLPGVELFSDPPALRQSVRSRVERAFLPASQMTLENH